MLQQTVRFTTALRSICVFPVTYHASGVCACLQLNSIQSASFHASEQLEDFKKQMNLNQEQLQQWTLAVCYLPTAIQIEFPYVTSNSCSIRSIS